MDDSVRCPQCNRLMYTDVDFYYDDGRLGHMYSCDDCLITLSK
ncbi:hypothetical protein LCGC14_1416630 [marine sediment metagenome]|uniref:Small CPxCG-related zinc finger protein n=1 Tax=marine sediment metagenome TaxID=412755 RepID=A0A0F9MUE7_9ZZZZ